MNLKTTKLFFSIFSILFFSFVCKAQSNDLIKMIMSAKTFMITEKYQGDFHSHIYNYKFTKKEKNIEVIWEEEISKISPSNKDSIIIEKIVKATTSISYQELQNTETFFEDCVSKIKKIKAGKSTEHSFYIFKSDSTTYEIDDDKSMVCVEDIKKWREKMFATGSK